MGEALTSTELSVLTRLTSKAESLLNEAGALAIEARVILTGLAPYMEKLEASVNAAKAVLEPKKEPTDADSA